MTQRCEDYPCCGHTDGLGCDYTTSYYQSAEYSKYLDLHYGCDHAAGWCHASDAMNDDEYCVQCGEPLNYYNGVEGVDYFWWDQEIKRWDRPGSYFVHQVSHFKCIPADAVVMETSN